MAANTITTLNGLFKEVYADKLLSLVPKAARFQKDAPFVSRDKQEGNQYHQPVRLTRAHGWTLSTSGDAFPLNPAEPARSADAVLQGSSFILREVISYTAAAKLLSGKGDNQKRAFVSGSSYMIENMTETAAFVLELQCMYGQSDVGVVSSSSSTAGVATVIFTAATFIPAMWSGLEQGFVDFWDTTGATQRNPSGTMQVTGVNVDTRTVTIACLQSEGAAIVATDKVYLRDTKSAGMIGMRTQIANTTTMFGINAATYSLWAGNTHPAASGSLSFAKALQAINKPTNRGLMEDVTMYCSPKSWTDMNNDLAALRRYADKAGGKLEQGAETLQYYGQTGAIEIVPHIYMKPSEAFVIPKDKMIRVGASELTFNPPGMDSGSFFENLPDHAGWGTRCYWNMAIFLPTPCKAVLINAIVNSDD